MPRTEVNKFAEAMEVELKENDYKGGWKECSLDFLINKLEEEVNELKNMAKQYDYVRHKKLLPNYEQAMEHNRKCLLSEAADVGNIAMMIADIYDAL